MKANVFFIELYRGFVDIPYYAGVYYTFLMPLLAEMSV
jgi:hypothetical protein